MGTPVTSSSAILGQVAPAAATPTLLYTAPAALQTFSAGGATLAGISICETGGAVALVRISFRINGAGDDIKQYVMRDWQIAANDFKFWPSDVIPGIAALPLGSGDLIYVYSSTGNVSFTAWGTPNL